ncbi:MAG: EAL domain-containing protein [Burkholderiales bacterium]|nr:EAL domain-containing protein [Burkholderiales bacterium]
MTTLPLHISEPAATPEPHFASRMSEGTTHTVLHDTVEAVAGYGRWWFDTDKSYLLLSSGAADFLDVEVGLHFSLESCFTHVVPEDLLLLLAALGEAGAVDREIDSAFRVVLPGKGLRWLRMQGIAQSHPRAGIKTGVLVDITPAMQLEMRERFSYAITQFLVGTQALGDAVVKVIQLVCENLGWEWGAYWAMKREPMQEPHLVCQYYWNHAEYALAPFTLESKTMQMTSGEGLVGTVWCTGEAAWIEDMQNDPSFLRRGAARECGLQSGYAFPVSYVAADGQRHSLGVLEFFSTLSRQSDAQLPNLSAVIGALIAQAIQRIEQQEHMRRLAQTDDLTGLSNRNYFHRRLEEACFEALRSDGQFGLLYIDLDRFKPINDAFGHDAGNAVLREFAQRLILVAHEGSQVARLGGDEFVIIEPLLHAGNAVMNLRALAERVLVAARTPFMFEEKELAVSASIGISIFGENGWTSQELLRSADEAMYRSKKAGRNAYYFFSGSGGQWMAEQQNSLAQQLTIEAELHRALVDNEFFLEYQPVVDSAGGKLLAIEALIRWRKPNGELMKPDMFIPIAEKSRLILQIGRWVVRQACLDLADLHRAGWADLKVHVNMAAVEFTDADLPHELSLLIEDCGIAAQHLCLELTEGMVMKQPEKVIPVMQMLRQCGFHISLDDFGIGHSSLSRLKKLPITSLKIDRAFVSGLPHDRGDSAIVRTILDLGRHMELQVVAEGVETDAQLVYLAQFGCLSVQGFLLGRPMSKEALMVMYKR